MKGTSTSAGTGDICCPFFRAHGDRDIICEEIVACAKCTVTRFKSLEDKKFHQQTYCEEHFKRCEIYLSIMHWRWTDDD